MHNAHWTRVLTGDPRGTTAQRTRRLAALAAIGRTHDEVLARRIGARETYAAHVREVAE